MKITREEIGGIFGTVLFGVLLLLILLFSYFTLSPPPQQLEGIPVMFGAVEDAYGIIESPMNEIESVPTIPIPPTPAPDQQLITQTTEPTIDIEAQREEEVRRREEEARRREEEARRREEETRRRQIDQQMAGLFGENTESRGNTEGTGTQGVTTGNATQGSPTGSGGIGSYDLGGRSLGGGGLVQPQYSVNDYGKVVVNITVDPSGKVIHAEIGQGTTTPNSTLRKEAVDAARRTKFNSINSANNQAGTITYDFKLN